MGTAGVREERVRLEVDWEGFLAASDMEWVVKPVSWDEGVFIGNGWIGAMVYGEENAKKRHVMRLVTGRTDVTASRSGGSGFPPRVPIGEMDLELAGMIYHPTRLRLDLWNAELQGSLSTTRGSIRFRALAHAVEPVMAAELEPSPGELEARMAWYAHAETDEVLLRADASHLYPYIPAAVIERRETGDLSVCIQRYEADGEGCVTAWKRVSGADGRSVYYISIAKGTGPEAVEQAAGAVRRASGTDFGEWVDAHRKWWHGYYRQSFVSIPDGRLESLYWIQMYKLASAARADTPLIDNQGPWLAPTPWAGAWFNMNVQMSYSPLYASGRLEIGQSLVRALTDHRQQLAANVPEAYRHDSAGLGRSSSLDLRSDVADETGNLTWLCHNLWRQYRYTMDERLLKEALYPILRASVQYYLHLLEEGEDGRLHLPPTVSPEYGSFLRTTVRDCSYDLALLRWGCVTLLEACARLGGEDPAQEARWKEVLARLADLPVDESGLMIGRDTPLAYGHRHFSHLLAVFPLHLIGTDDEGERRLIARSLRHWLGLEGDLRGFSLTGAASIAAVLGRGSQALRLLHALLLRLLPNTMYREAGPVIETPLAAAESIHDMLLQSWGGIIRVFPAVPQEWSDAAFHELRTEGAFLVSAVRQGGETRFIRVKSLAGEPCVLRTGWTGDVLCCGPADGDSPRLVRLGGPAADLRLALRPGEEAVLYPASTPRPELTIRPVEAPGRPHRFYGGHKPWRLYGFPFEQHEEEGTQ
ncbi:MULTISPECIES: glycosyl hydrolase family 95 catalytic domain-containing protein [Paenibacillus]|uniref:glycosyl hydrolase family 95 catalytic domain-containing protein n=1 Tax=Paenibacillus TaxID=44249 RepID=UPI0022B88AEB|nr:hypothetical protein [Paenibacillus caseinilyticus]MCZ8520351.1 hypothetical protein [Paenibacillus caseinilyticus]